MKNWLFLCLCFPLSLMGQTEKKAISFEDTENYKLIKGKTEVVSDGYKGRSMSLASESEVRFPLQLLPGSKYNVTAWLKTSSGADNVSLQVEGLGRYNTGVSSALASWSKVEFIVNLPEGDADVTLCAVLGKTIGDTPAFVDEISIVRIGDFKEMKYTGIPNRKKREIKSKEVRFCLSIVMDTTGSMGSYINATRDNIVKILDKLKEIERSHHLPEGGIVGQVVQYKNFNGRCYEQLYGETANYITNDFNRLKNKLASFRTSGGGDGCGDVQGGLVRALEQMKQAPYNTYNHLILVVGDYAYHGDTPGCSVKTFVNGKSIYTVWDEVYNDIRSFKGIRVMFMPISPAEIRLTMQRMQNALGPKIVDSAEVTTETNFVEVVTNTAVTEYKRFIGIS